VKCRYLIDILSVDLTGHIYADTGNIVTGKYSGGFKEFVLCKSSVLIY